MYDDTDLESTPVTSGPPRQTEQFSSSSVLLGLGVFIDGRRTIIGIRLLVADALGRLGRCAWRARTSRVGGAGVVRKPSYKVSGRGALLLGAEENNLGGYVERFRISRRCSLPNQGLSPSISSAHSSLRSPGEY